MLDLAAMVLHREELSPLLATIPIWPLVGSLLIGLILVLGRGRQFAPFAVIAGAAISTALGFVAFFGMMNKGDAAGHAQLDNGYALLATQSSHASDETAHTPQPAELHDSHAAAQGAGDGGHAGPQHVFYKARTLFHWISLGDDQDTGQTRWIDVNFFVDSLTGIMLVVVTFISLMVFIYATGYMRDHHGHKEVGYERFFAWLGLFVFSMLVLVMAGNFVVLYLGWEAVGLCSYLLIGFYYQKPAAAAAAKKAFLVNRIGDFGFALGIFAIYYFLSPVVRPNENPLDYETLFKYAPQLAEMSLWGMSAPTVIGLLLMCGALGKSAQFPLYVWLPDAMEGPTPVSALIHAATMVTAGVYMIARLGPIYSMTPAGLTVVMWLGLIGAILAATMAMAQYDMKRILAYSTMSQLAFMFVALGVGAPQAAIFHLFTHAFFKALLFLGAGGVMHAMGNVIDIRYFSGLRHVMRTTYLLMLIGCLALAGFPLMAGFWSKDEIVHAALDNRPVAGWLLLATAAMTAYYTFRMFFMAFNGPERYPAEAGEHPHESPPVMLWPLYPLALGAIFAGFLGWGGEHSWLHGYFATSTMVTTAHHLSGAMWVMILSSVVAIAFIGLALLRYGQAPQDEPDQRALGPIWNLWNAKYFIDEIYQALIVNPLRRLGRAFFSTDRNGIDAFVDFVGRVPQYAGGAARTLQRGAVQGYALAMVLGLGLLFLLWKWVSPA